MTTAFRLTADTILIIHVGFVLFVLFGGLLVRHRPWLAWLHVPAVAWGVLIEYGGWICPLTPLENYLRVRGGVTPYGGDFIEHYVLPLLYPAQLTRGLQILFGSCTVLVNGLVYWQMIRRRRRAA